MRRFGRELREARKAKDLSQAEVAAALGISQAAVDHWEQGRRIPTGTRQIELRMLLGNSRLYTGEAA